MREREKGRQSLAKTFQLFVAEPGFPLHALTAKHAPNYIVHVVNFGTGLVATCKTHAQLKRTNETTTTTTKNTNSARDNDTCREAVELVRILE